VLNYVSLEREFVVFPASSLSSLGSPSAIHRRPCCGVTQTKILVGEFSKRCGVFLGFVGIFHLSSYISGSNIVLLMTFDSDAGIFDIVQLTAETAMSPCLFSEGSK
jgi:hypothetical protein